MQSPVIVVNTSKQRESGRKAQMSNIAAGKTVADVVRTCLGPRAMLKMLLDPMGGITLTNDGFAILRECEVAHPAAKSMIELSRTQDDEVGDGTTSVIILAGEMLAISAPFLERKIHPVIILRGFQKALEDAQDILRSIAVRVDTNDRKQMLALIKSAIGTKFVSRWNDLMCNLALSAVQTVIRRSDDAEFASADLPVAKITDAEPAKPLAGSDASAAGATDSGVPATATASVASVSATAASAAVASTDAASKKDAAKSQAPDVDVREIDIKRFVRIEKVPGGEIEESRVLDGVMINKDVPDLVITEKGVSDLAQHYLVKHNITALRRMRKTDNNRIARATGAKIVTSVDELKEQDVGTGCGLFSVEKIGDEYFTFLTKCKDPKACTILLRGPGKDTLNEIDRNLQDAMCVARNVLFNPYLCPGGGATEMALSVQLAQRAKSDIPGVEQWPYAGVAEALEVIPRTLIQNGGGNAMRTLTELRAKHASGLTTWGVDGEKGISADMNDYGVWEPLAVKLQTIKTAIDSASLLLRVDDIVSATAKKH
ncbi:T-complex protein 1 subunit gamma [Coemansia thaxteri]|nr:T-complex protein 1 subunit gamma [Coemansia thaxteri]